MCNKRRSLGVAVALGVARLPIQTDATMAHSSPMCLAPKTEPCSSTVSSNNTTLSLLCHSSVGLGELMRIMIQLQKCRWVRYFLETWSPDFYFTPLSNPPLPKHHLHYLYITIGPELQPCVLPIIPSDLSILCCRSTWLLNSLDPPSWSLFAHLQVHEFKA